MGFILYLIKSSYRGYCCGYKDAFNNYDDIKVGDGVRYCDNASCKYCIRGSCVSSVVKLTTMDDSPDEHLICQSYESRWQDGD